MQHSVYNERDARLDFDWSFQDVMPTLLAHGPRGINGHSAHISQVAYTMSLFATWPANEHPHARASASFGGSPLSPIRSGSLLLLKLAACSSYLSLSMPIENGDLRIEPQAPTG